MHFLDLLIILVSYLKRKHHSEFYPGMTEVCQLYKNKVSFTSLLDPGEIYFPLLV